jgi:uncharacterized membrane protein YhaH (DUF805 family)
MLRSRNGRHWLAKPCVAIIKLLIPFLDNLTGMPIIGKILLIVLWAFVAIAVVVINLGLLSYLLGGSGTFGFPKPDS